MKYALIILFVCIWRISFSQTYSIQKDTASYDSYFLQELPQNKRFNVQRIIKAGISLPLLKQSSFTPLWYTGGINATMERKIKGGLGILVSAEANYGFSKGARLFTIETPVALRYYFSLGKTMRKRLDKHSFFSHYVALQTHNVFISNLHYDPVGPLVDIQRYERGKITNTINNSGVYNDAYDLMQFVNLQLGSQFRIGRDKFLDINVLLPIPVYYKYNYVIATPALLNVKYGIVWK